MRKLVISILFISALAMAALLHGCGKSDGTGVGGKVIISGAGE